MGPMLQWVSREHPRLADPVLDWPATLPRRRVRRGCHAVTVDNFGLSAVSASVAYIARSATKTTFFGPSPSEEGLQIDSERSCRGVELGTRFQSEAGLRRGSISHGLACSVGPSDRSLGSGSRGSVNECLPPLWRNFGALSHIRRSAVICGGAVKRAFSVASDETRRRRPCAVPRDWQHSGRLCVPTPSGRPRPATEFQRLASRRSTVDEKQREMREHYLGVGVGWGTALGLASGAGVGVALGHLALGIGIGLAVGAGIGIAFGAALGDERANSDAASPLNG